jgi:hypothetical protein
MLGRWVTESGMGGYVGKGDGEPKLVKPACYGSSLGSNPDISHKYKMGEINKGVANTLKHGKKYTKKHLGEQLDLPGFRRIVWFGFLMFS